MRERVSIRDIGSILEALLEMAPVNKSQVALVEAARQALGRRLIKPLLDNDGMLPVLLLDPAIEEEIISNSCTGDQPTSAVGDGGSGNSFSAPSRRFCEPA